MVDPIVCYAYLRTQNWCNNNANVSSHKHQRSTKGHGERGCKRGLCAPSARSSSGRSVAPCITGSADAHRAMVEARKSLMSTAISCAASAFCSNVRMPPVRTHIHPHTNQQGRAAGAAAEAKAEGEVAAAVKVAAAMAEGRAAAAARARQTNTHATHTCRPIPNVVEDNSRTLSSCRQSKHPHAPDAHEVATQQGHLVVEKICTTSVAARRAGSL
jgi:hypothetical protein